jgi:hypothetical protein
MQRGTQRASERRSRSAARVLASRAAWQRATSTAASWAAKTKRAAAVRALQHTPEGAWRRRRRWDRAGGAPVAGRRRSSPSSSPRAGTMLRKDRTGEAHSARASGAAGLQRACWHRERPGSAPQQLQRAGQPKRGMRRPLGRKCTHTCPAAKASRWQNSRRQQMAYLDRRRRLADRSTRCRGKHKNCTAGGQRREQSLYR